MSASSPETRSKGRPRADAIADLDTHLLDVASSAFLAHGYAATSVAHVIRTAKVSSKTVYARYAGKQELFVAVVERLLAPTRISLARSLAAIDHDIVQGLLEIGMANARHWTAPTEIGLYRLLIAEGRRFPELVAIYRRTTEPANQILINLLDAAVLRNALEMEDPHEAARVFNHLTNTHVRDEALLGNQLSGDVVAKHVREGLRLFMRLYTPSQTK